MFLSPKPHTSWRILCGLRGGKDYLIVVRFDTPKHEQPYQQFHAWALNFFEGLYSALPEQSVAGAFIGTPEELKREIEKELK